IASSLFASRFEHERTLFDRQTEGLLLLQRADLARSPGELDGAQVELSEFLAIIKDEPRLDFLAIRITEARKRISDRLTRMQSQQAEQNRLQAERDRLQKFRSLRNEAQLYAARLMVVDPVEHQKMLRATVRSALAVYGQEPEAAATAWSLAQPLSGALN